MWLLSSECGEICKIFAFGRHASADAWWKFVWVFAAKIELREWILYAYPDRISQLSAIGPVHGGVVQEVEWYEWNKLYQISDKFDFVYRYNWKKVVYLYDRDGQYSVGGQLTCHLTMSTLAKFHKENNISYSAYSASFENLTETLQREVGYDKTSEWNWRMFFNYAAYTT